MIDQRKKMALLCLLLVISGGWIAFASRSGASGGNAQSGLPASTPSFQSDPRPDSTPGLGLGNREGSPSALGKSELFLRMMLSVGLVIGLGGIALVLSKRALPRMVRCGGKEIHIRETAYLGPRKALHLVEVGSQRLLIASTHDRITMLAPVSDAWLGVSNTEDCAGESLDLSQRGLDEAVKT